MGDKLKSSYLINSLTTIIVDSIDTVLINNKYRKKFFLQEISVIGFIFDSIIEGIGSSSGFAQMLGCSNVNIGSPCALDCVGDSAGAYFPTVSAFSCQIPTSISKNGFSAKKFRLFPNPTNGKIHFEGDVNLKSIVLFNHQGQSIQTINPKHIEFELPQTNGLYLIRLEDENGNFFMEKVIKN